MKLLKRIPASFQKILKSTLGKIFTVFFIALIIFLASNPVFIKTAIKKGPIQAFAQEVSEQRPISNDWSSSEPTDSISNPTGDWSVSEPTYVSDQRPIDSSSTDWSNSEPTYVSEQRPIERPSQPEIPAVSRPRGGSGRTITNEGGRCIGTHAWWVRDFSDGTTENVKDHGETGECGQTASTTPVDTSTGDWEGAGCDGQDSVWGIWGADGSLKEVKNRVGKVPGECNNPIKTITFEGARCRGNESWWVKDFNDGTTEWVKNHGQQVGECGNEASFEGPGCSGSNSVWGIWSRDGSRLITEKTNFGRRPGECGNPVTPLTPPVTPSPAPACFEQVISTRNTCVGQQLCQVQSRRRSNCSIVDDSPTNCQSVDGFCGFSSPRPTPTPTPTPTPAATQAVTQQQFQCNDGRWVNSAVQCQQQQQTQQQFNNQVVTLAGQPASPVSSGVGAPMAVRTVEEKQAPQVTQIAGEVRELPRTGIPAVAWGFIGLLPLGLSLRKFGRSVKENITANYLWEERQFKK